MALPVSFRWDEEFIARVDEARGDVPRSTWIRRTVEMRLAGELSPQWVVTRSGSAPPPDKDFSHLAGVPVVRASALRSRQHAATCRCGICVPVKGKS